MMLYELSGKHWNNFWLDMNMRNLVMTGEVFSRSEKEGEGKSDSNCCFPGLTDQLIFLLNDAQKC